LQPSSSISHRIHLVAVTLAVTVAAALPVYLTGALAVQMRSELHMTESQFGTVLASYFVSATLGSLFLGGVVDGWGWGRGLRAATLVSALSLTTIGLMAHSWRGLFVCLSVAGLGGAIAQPSSNLALTRRVPVDQQGLSFGAKQSAIPLAVLLGGLAVPVLAMTAGWRSAFLLSAAFASVAALAVPADS
jgi:MFS family permease